MKAWRKAAEDINYAAGMSHQGRKNKRVFIMPKIPTMLCQALFKRGNIAELNKQTEARYKKVGHVVG